MKSKAAPASEAHAETRLRVIGGTLRGRGFRYNGDPHLRPMKDRVREAVFNLVGPAVKDTVVIDLFGGTGAMSFESLSRGARSATIIERRFPNVRVIQENAESLGIAERVEAQGGDAFVAYRRLTAGSAPWLVFCCPPYEFYVSRKADLLTMLAKLISIAPPTSQFVVEADARLDFAELPQAGEWDVRPYPPAIIGILRLP